ncbi:MAG TPA: DUF3048 domain-containing protein [Microlunatus sp.]|nr:DUF3048 domain-containing protein [Microlunatus sp.]
MPTSRFVWKRGHTVAAVVAVVVLVGGGTATALIVGGNDSATTAPVASGSSTAPTTTPTSAPSPTPVDPLTGGRVADREVIAVKVENIAAARPQVGLRNADIVFVEEVEGAQTRLVAVYHTDFPRRLGPVRSARSTDVQLLPLFGKPGLVYSGANRNVQGKIHGASIVPIERSTRDRRRVAPHNVFVNLHSIADSVRTGAARDIGWRFAADDPRWDPAPAAERPSATVGNDTFTFDWSRHRYGVRWRGQPYTDGDSGKTATTDNIVVMAVRNHPDGNRDVLGSASVMSDTVGHGKVTVYRDGKKMAGAWRRTSPSGVLRFIDADGRDIPLAPGKTWVLLKG